MNLIIKFLLVIPTIIFITLLHIGGPYILPYPVSFMNILFVVILIFLFILKSGVVVWFSFFTHFIVELYVTTTPFGIILFASTLSILFVFWAHQYIFTNKSWYAGASITALAIIFYRTIYIITLLLSQFLINNGRYEIFWGELFIMFIWELLFTTIMVGVFFLFLSFFHPVIKNKTSENQFLRSFGRS